jgi:hypothetical protein
MHSILALVGAAALVAAHGILDSVIIDGTKYGPTSAACHYHC